MSATAPMPSTWAALVTALHERHPVQVSYHGRHRIVCPHALGWKSQRPLLLAYQTGGQTSTGTLPPDPTKRWRCLFIDEIDHVTTGVAAPWQTASNYDPSQPFPTPVELVVAIGPNGGPSPS